MSQVGIPQLIAHRGFSLCYPENTLLAIEQAFIAGACYVECDVHLTRDGEPVLLHDVELQRTTGQPGNINSLKLEQIKNVSAHFESRFGQKYVAEPIPTLAQLVSVMSKWRERRVFVEIKRATIREFGREFVLQKVIDVVEPIANKVIIISFDYEIMQLVKNNKSFQTGWVIEEWSSSNLKLAAQLKPDYMFVDHECIPEKLATLPSVSWHWVLYEIDSVEIADKWLQKGATFIETNDIGGLLTAAVFKQSGCYG